MDANKREIRTVDCQLAIREAEGSQESESRTITGTAIVFNAESEVLDDWGERFREVILPSAATMEFLNRCDIKMNMLHDRDLTIARCNKGVGSMRLSVDERGVNFEFEAPRCDLGDRCLEMVRRGDYSGCSFEFYPKDYEVERNGDEVKIIHKEFEFISALTIGMDPAYRQTTVNARELGKPQETEEERKAREAREQAEREAAAQREEEAKARELEAELCRRAARIRKLNEDFLESTTF
jgi:HK97 family phage prohead protease